MRLGCAASSITLIAASPAAAQPTNEQLALGAGIDCHKGRYTQGIRALEDLLSRNRISYPPLQY